MMLLLVLVSVFVWLSREFLTFKTERKLWGWQHRNLLQISHPKQRLLLKGGKKLAKKVFVVEYFTCFFVPVYSLLFYLLASLTLSSLQ